MATGTSPHVPAWKRLGLKLKYANDEAAQHPPGHGMNGTKHVKSNDSSSKEPPRKKRRFSDSDEPPSSTLPKMNGPSKESEDAKLKKKVSFTSDTKTKDGDTARPANPPIVLPHTNGSITSDNNSDSKHGTKQDGPPSPKPEKQPKSKSKKHSAPTPSKPKAGLSYLTTFSSSHPTWKFSKNHSTWLLKNALSDSAIPRSYNFPLACYLHNLQSTAARERLKSECEKARLVDDNWGKQHIDHNRVAEFLSAVKLFTANPEGFDKPPAVAWAEEQKRTDIIWWILHPDGLHHPAGANEMRQLEADFEVAKSKPVPEISASDMDEVPQKRRNRKSRTTITAADISSSSSSSSSSSDSEGSDSKDDETGEDGTSSSSSDSD